MTMRCFRFDGADGWQWQAGGTLRQGDTADAVLAAGGQPVQILLASPQAWVCGHVLPRLPPARLARAAAFAVEDQLASDLDTVHVAVGKRRADGLTELAVIGRADMDSVLAYLRQAGFEVAGITPLAALLPVGAASVLAEPDCLTVRLGAQASLCGPAAHISVLLRALAPPGLIWLQTPGGTPPAAESGADVVAVPADEALRRAAREGGINLLQGAYAPVRPPGQWRLWRPAAVLASLWLALLLAGGALETRRLGQQNAALRVSVGAEFTRLFPEEGRPVSLRAQALRRLKLLGGSGQGGGALALLTVAARALPPGQNVTGLDYKDGALTLDMSLPDVAAVEALRETLAAERAVKTELPVAVAEGGAVRTRLVLTQAASAVPAPAATTPRAP
ncbi:MAG: type II secretion system protein GspL [Immundisolibacter sp.]|uniref:type II secretion system protein GspL n=1 Tax=Immundisolibacter sp. TaxID=1934948 RepID=UPI003EE29B82